MSTRSFFHGEPSRHFGCLVYILLLLPLACEGVWWQHGAPNPSGSLSPGELGLGHGHHPLSHHPSSHPKSQPNAHPNARAFRPLLVSAPARHSGALGGAPSGVVHQRTGPDAKPLVVSYTKGRGKPKVHSFFFGNGLLQDLTVKHADDGEAHHFDILANRGTSTGSVSWAKNEANSQAAKAFAALSRRRSKTPLPDVNSHAQLGALTAPTPAPAPAPLPGGAPLQVQAARDPSDIGACGKLPDLEARVHAFWEWARHKGASIDMRHNRLEHLLEDILRCRRHAGLHMGDTPGPACKLRSAVGVSDSVVLVGNGASVMKAGPNSGAMIDAFDDVMRFNNVNVKGFEEAVGKKTTLLFVGSVSEICACVREMKRFGLKSSMCCNDLLALKFWRNFEGQSLKFLSASTRLPVFLLSAPSAPLSVRSLARVWRVSSWPTGEGGNKVLSALAAAGHKGLKTRFQPKSVLRNGMYAVIMLLECGIRPTLAGFDIRLDNNTHYVHHYYPLAGEPVKAFTGHERNSVMKEHQKGYHDFMTEAKVLRELLAEGLIHELGDGGKGHEGGNDHGGSHQHDGSHGGDGSPGGDAHSAGASSGGAKAPEVSRAAALAAATAALHPAPQKPALQFRTQPIRWIPHPNDAHHR